MVRLPFLKKTPKQPDKFLTLEINSTCVRCLAFYQENGKSKIIGSGKQPLEHGSVRSGAIIDDEDVIEATRIAVAQATQDLEDNINQTIINVGGDLCLGLMTTVRLKRGKANAVSQREIDSLCQRIIETSQMQIQSEYLETTGSPDTDLEIIISSNVYTKLDGVAFDDPINKEAKTIEIAIFSAFAPAHHLADLKKIAKASDLEILAISPTLYAIVQQLKHASLENTDFVLIDVANDSTDVAVVFGKGILSTKNLNIGYIHFVEGISEKMGLTISESAKVIKGYVEEKLTAGESSIVHNFLTETLDIWLAGLELLFKEFRGVRTFAPKVYVTGTGTYIPNIVEAVSKEPWMKSIPFKEPPEFKKVDFMDFIKISDATNRINTSEWVTPASLSIIYSEIFREQEEQPNDQN